MPIFKKIFSILAIVLVFFLAILAGRYSYLKLLDSRTKKDAANAPASVFSKFAKKDPAAELSNKLAKEVEEEFKDDPQGLLFFKYGWEVIEFKPNAPTWDYKTTPFLASITAVENADGKSADLTVEFSALKSMPLIGQTQKIHVACEQKFSFIKGDGKNEGMVANITNLFEEGQVFSGFCTNEKCVETTRYCKVFKI